MAAKKKVVELPCREEREEMLRVLIGRPDKSVDLLPKAMRAKTNQQYDLFILPLIRQHWPEILNQPIGRKLRFLACDLYATSSYTVLFSAPNRPLIVKVATDSANLLPLPQRALAHLSSRAMDLIGKLAFSHEHKRIIHIAAFIATVDHTFDHCMEEPAQERGRKLKAILDGEEAPDTKPLKLTRAIQEGMSDGLLGWEVEPFYAAMQRVKDWIDSEVAGMTDVEDETGLGHRVAGVEGTIDGLIFPVHRYAGEGTRQWMYDVSMFVQMMDDWLDYEDDRETDRVTPVITGSWSFQDISQMWWKTVRGIESLVRDGGLRSPHYVRFVRKCYELMLHEVMDAMANGMAD